MPTAVVTERTRELEAVNEEQVRVIEEQKAAIYRLKVEAGDHTGALCWCPAFVPCVGVACVGGATLACSNVANVARLQSCLLACSHLRQSCLLAS